MTDAQFEALVGRLDAEARRNPAGYRRWVVLLALAGYTYIALVILAALVPLILSIWAIATLGAIALKLILIFSGFIWLVLRSLWVRIEPPQGRRLLPEEAPELFALIEDLRRQLKSVPVHRVLVTEELNASVAQTPRLGLFGWHRNTLLLGLPLMKALSREQFAAVLAHEFGHLAGGHGRLGNWIYRLRAGWSRLAEVLRERAPTGGFLFKPFFAWFVPYFSATSFPLARTNEYDADATAARLTSPAAAAAALTGLSVVGTFLEARFWPGLHRQADDLPHPAFTPFAAMGEAMRGDIDPASLHDWLEQALARPTSLDNTHPSLSDRLRALGEAPRLELPDRSQAADTLLGPALPAVTAEFDERWQRLILPSWERRHGDVREGRALLAALDERAARADDTAPLTLDERLQRARLTEDFAADNTAARAQLEALHREAPSHPGVCFSLGWHLLEEMDARGPALMTAAIEGDPDFLLSGAGFLRDYHIRQGQHEEAARWHERWHARALELQAFEEERSRVLLGDTLAAHDLMPEQIAQLRQQLRTIKGLRRVWMARKAFTDPAQPPLLLVGFTTGRWWSLPSEARGIRIRDEILGQVEFPLPALVFRVEGTNRRFRRKFRKVRGSRVL